MSGKADPDWAEATRLLHPRATPGLEQARAARTVNPPIQRASTVLLPDAASLYTRQPSYGLAGLGVQGELEAALCELEGAHAVRLFSSGSAAIAAALLSVLKAGDEILVSAGAYAPTRRLCEGLLARFGVLTRYFAPDAEVGAVMALATPATRLLLLESPATFTFELQDVPALAAAARARGLLTLMDNTWGAGLLFKPLAHGVDLSVQALTKYASGGSDVFLGSVAVGEPALAEALLETVWDVGFAVSPDDGYTVLRSLRTLPVRMGRHGASALEVAGWLAERAEVAEVLCPALPGAPGHALWRRDFTGSNGLFGVELRPGPPGAAAAFLDALQLFGLGFSWGGFESLAVDASPQVRNPARGRTRAGALLRLHIGLEEPRDLVADLRRGLDAFAAACQEA